MTEQPGRMEGADSERLPWIEPYREASAGPGEGIFGQVFAAARCFATTRSYCVRLMLAWRIFL